ncbi:hypothetical protein [Roseomonas rosulenta]|uniref:hypothetical protein n=1 Tax=Roseomonas rosulenta TaxID=2748667 RepID=UPI0018DFBE54|nr:hypothetical protein [Roseomonas rosulenta]
MALGPTSFEPHYHAHGPSHTMQRHVVEPLLIRAPDQPLGTLDPATRHGLWHRATRPALSEDVAVRPLHHHTGLEAMRRGSTDVARSDEATYAMGIRAVTPP